MHKYGWAKIKSVEVQYWYDEFGAVEYSGIWISDDEGNIFARDLKKSENEEDVAAYYRKRSWTDSDCYLFKAA